eukprot:gene15776-23474_t
MQYCSSLAPCSKIFVSYPELPASAATPIIHTSLTSLTRYEGCSYDNRVCDSRDAVTNVQAAEEWMRTDYPVNHSFTCFFDPLLHEDVVVDKDILKSDISHSLVWPICLLFFGSLLVLGSSKTAQNCCESGCTAICFPFKLLAACFARLKANCETDRTHTAASANSRSRRRGRSRGRSNSDSDSENNSSSSDSENASSVELQQRRRRAVAASDATGEVPPMYAEGDRPPSPDPVGFFSTDDGGGEDSLSSLSSMLHVLDSPPAAELPSFEEISSEGLPPAYGSLEVGCL